MVMMYLRRQSNSIWFVGRFISSLDELDRWRQMRREAGNRTNHRNDHITQSGGDELIRNVNWLFENAKIDFAWHMDSVATRFERAAMDLRVPEFSGSETGL